MCVRVCVLCWYLSWLKARRQLRHQVASHEGVYATPSHEKTLVYCLPLARSLSLALLLLPLSLSLCFFLCSRQIPRNLIYIFYLIFLNISLAVYVHQSVTKTHASTNKAPADTVASWGYLPLASPFPPFPLELYF